MSKDPAFLLYSNDMLSGMEGLTMEERGQYITLLLLQHQKGHLTEKMITLCVGNAAADVMAKFRQDPAGLWYNVRLEQEAEKRTAHAEKQKQRAIEGWKNRKNNTKSKPSESHGNAAAMPLESVNENVIVNENTLDKKERIKISIFDDTRFLGDVSRMYPGRDLLLGFDQCWNHFSEQPAELLDWEWRNKFSSWVGRMEIKKVNGNKYKVQ